MNDPAAEAMVSCVSAPKPGRGVTALAVLGVVAGIAVSLFGYFWAAQLLFGLVFHPITMQQAVGLAVLTTGLSLPPALLWKALR